MNAPPLETLVALHRGLCRLGPGDDAFSQAVLDGLTDLPSDPDIADLGCGTGAGALLLARRYHRPVIAVDDQQGFLDDMMTRAGRAGCASLVSPRCADIAAPGIAPASLDLLCSEGAAYAIGFGRALRAWRPLLRPGGYAVVSELTWFTEDPPEEARGYWADAYPDMADEAVNRGRADAAGLVVRDVRRLPAVAWQRNYAAPLDIRLDAAAGEAADTSVIDECRREADLQRRFGQSFGYAFYVLQAPSWGPTPVHVVVSRSGSASVQAAPSAITTASSVGSTPPGRTPR